MSFLNQLKSQAQELQSKRSDEDRQRLVGQPSIFA
jgi:hypothetical protein